MRKCWKWSVLLPYIGILIILNTPWAFANNLGPAQNIKAVSAHEPGQLSKEPIIEIEWSVPEGYTRGGIEGYYYLFDDSATAVLNEFNTDDMEPINKYYASGNFESYENKPCDDQKIYFHIAPYILDDDDELVFGQTETIGPFRIDVVAPENVQVIPEEVTYDRNLELTMIATETLKVLISNRNYGDLANIEIDENQWRELDPLMNAPITEGEGNKTLYVYFKDGAGNIARKTVTTYYQPRLTVELTCSLKSPTNISPITLVATFSQAVTDFNESDIELSSAIVSDLSGADDIYTFLITPNSEDVTIITVQIPENAASGNLASDLITIKVDLKKPTIKMDSSIPEYANTLPWNLTISTNESVIGFDVHDIEGDGFERKLSKQTERAYILQITPTKQGVITISIPANKFQDEAGNLNEALNYTRIFDTVAPTFSGVEDVTITVGDNFNQFEGVVPNDDFGIYGNIQVTGNVYPDIPGDYNLRYSVEDNAGNIGTATRTITVLSHPIPFTVKTITSPYLPGHNYVLPVTIAYTEVMTKIKYTIDLPDGWSYESMWSKTGPKPNIDNDNNKLSLEWNGNLQEQLSFVYSLSIPDNVTGTRDVTVTTTCQQGIEDYHQIENLKIIEQNFKPEHKQQNGSVYKQDETVDIKVHIGLEKETNQYNKLTAVGMMVQLPNNWSFNSIKSISDPSEITDKQYPKQGDTGLLEFFWHEIKNNDIQLKYEVNTPTTTASETITATVKYRFANGMEKCIPLDELKYTSSEPSEVTLTVQTDDVNYTPGEDLNIPVLIQFTKGMTAVGYEIKLPDNWEYKSVGGDNLPLTTGYKDKLEFSWKDLDAETVQISFNYTISVLDSSNPIFLTATVRYRHADGLELKENETFKLTPSDVPQGVEFTTDFSPYLPDNNYVLPVTIDLNDADRSNMKYTIDLPPGWTYESMWSKTAPMPTINDTELSFEWENKTLQGLDQVSFVYTLGIPKDITGSTYSVLETVTYKLGDEQKQLTKTHQISRQILKAEHRQKGGVSDYSYNKTVGIDVHIGLEKDTNQYNKLTAVGMMVQLPDEWSFYTITNAPEPTGITKKQYPQKGDKGLLEFFWHEIKNNDIKFTYDVKTPTTTPNQTITATVKYRFANGMEKYISLDDLKYTTEPSEVTLTVQTPDVDYTPGEDLNIPVLIQFTEGMTAIGYDVKLPDGWTYDSVGGDNPPPVVEENDNIEFSWTNFNEKINQLSFNYKVRVPDTENSESVDISATVLYRHADGLEFTENASFIALLSEAPHDIDVKTEISPYLPGNNYVLPVTIDFKERTGMTYLEYAIKLPNGWTYQSMWSKTETLPDEQHTDASLLTFEWMNNELQNKTKVTFVFSLSTSTTIDNPVPVTVTYQYVNENKKQVTESLHITQQELIAWHKQKDSDSNYYENSFVDVNVHIGLKEPPSAYNKLTSVGMMVQLPNGWTYDHLSKPDDLSGNSAKQYPKKGDDGLIQFAWFELENDIECTYTIKTPTNTATETITATVQYRFANGQKKTHDLIDLTYTLSDAPAIQSISPESGQTVNSGVITLTFTEDVTGFEANDLTIINGSVKENSFTGSGQNYTFEIIPDDQGSFGFTIPKDTVQDLDGKSNLVDFSFTFTYDSIPPTVELKTSEISPTQSLSIPITVIFSEPVDGFVVSDISLTNAAPVGDLIEYSDNLYSFNIKPDSPGDVLVSIPAGAANDKAGNLNEKSNTLSLTYESKEITLTVQTDARGFFPGQDYNVPVLIKFTEGMTAVGYEVKLPNGWTYKTVGGENQPTVVEENDNIEFSWTNLNEDINQLSFNYTLETPESVPSDTIQISATVRYRHADDLEFIENASFVTYLQKIQATHSTPYTSYLPNYEVPIQVKIDNVGVHSDTFSTLALIVLPPDNWEYVRYESDFSTTPTITPSTNEFRFEWSSVNLSENPINMTYYVKPLSGADSQVTLDSKVEYTLKSNKYAIPLAALPFNMAKLTATHRCNPEFGSNVVVTTTIGYSGDPSSIADVQLSLNIPPEQISQVMLPAIKEDGIIKLIRIPDSNPFDFKYIIKPEPNVQQIEIYAELTYLRTDVAPTAIALTETVLQNPIISTKNTGDTTPPTITSVDYTSEILNMLQDVTLTITFSEALEAFDTSNISVVHEHESSKGHVKTISSSGNTYTATIQPEVCGDMHIRINDIFDEAGNKLIPEDPVATLLFDCTTYEGSVKDTNGKNLHDVFVKIVSPIDDPYPSTTTKDDGSYSLSRPRNDQYDSFTLTLEKTGYVFEKDTFSISDPASISFVYKFETQEMEAPDDNQYTIVCNVTANGNELGPYSPTVTIIALGYTTTIAKGDTQSKYILYFEDEPNGKVTISASMNDYYTSISTTEKSVMLNMKEPPKLTSRTETTVIKKIISAKRGGKIRLAIEQSNSKKRSKNTTNEISIAEAEFLPGTLSEDKEVQMRNQINDSSPYATHSQILEIQSEAQITEEGEIKIRQETPSIDYWDILQGKKAVYYADNLQAFNSGQVQEVSIEDLLPDEKGYIRFRSRQFASSAIGNPPMKQADTGQRRCFISTLESFSASTKPLIALILFTIIAGVIRKKVSYFHSKS